MKQKQKQKIDKQKLHSEGLEPTRAKPNQISSSHYKPLTQIRTAQLYEYFRT